MKKGILFVLFAWWFLIGAKKIGPFDTEEDCQKIRHVAAANTIVTAISPCWHTESDEGGK